MPEWKPIHTAPTDGSHVFLYRPQIRFVGYYANDEVGWCHCSDGVPEMDPQPTHWMPLPKMPVDKSSDRSDG